MKRLFLRALPLIVALIGGGLGYAQFRFPLSYPWPLVGLFVIFFATAAFFAKENRHSFSQTLQQIIPATLFLIALTTSVLLVETIFIKWLVTILFFLVPLIVLELLYLAYFKTFHYPVNAISRVNVAFVPAIGFLSGVCMNGLQTFLGFLKISPLFGLIIFPIVIGTLYFVTSHPTADTMHRLRWAALGAVLGLQSAILVLLLPVTPSVHGAIVAILISIPLRIRRYAYAPKPSKRLAWFEGVTILFVFVTILLISPWA